MNFKFGFVQNKLKKNDKFNLDAVYNLILGLYIVRASIPYFE